MWLKTKNSSKTIILIILFFALVRLVGSTPQPALAQAGQSLAFIQNVGQFEESIRFQTYGGPVTLSLTEDALWLTAIDQRTGQMPTGEITADELVNVSKQGVNLRFAFINAHPSPRLEPFNRLDTQFSYFTGPNPTHWQVDVPVWGGVRYVDLYPGIDLEITGQDGHLSPRLVVRQELSELTDQGATTLSEIGWQIEGTDGLSLDQAGRLHLSTAVGEFTFPLLQVEPAAEVETAAAGLSARLEGNRLLQPFTTASVLPDTPVEITGLSDLLYSTFLGGDGQLDAGRDLAVDEAGNAYVTGQAYPGFPTTPGAFDTDIDGVESDTFVAKLSSDGSSLEFATFLGGRDFDTAWGISLDGAGNIYLGGYTKSDDFPLSPGAFDTTYEGFAEAYVAKLNPTGSELIYATFLGGNDTDLGWGIAVGDDGLAYFTGFTESPDFPTTPGAFDTTLDAWYDVFVAKLNADGSDLFYSTLIGGNNADYSFGGIAVDDQGSAYVSGYTHSTDFPVTPGALDTTYNQQEAFVAKVVPDGSSLAYATYLGGSNTEYTEAILVGETGQVYVTGTTRSEDFPVTPGAFDTSYNTTDIYSGDAFVATLTADGSGMAYATFLGGSQNDIGHDLALDSSGSIYVVGHTESPNFPTTPNGFDTSCEGCTDLDIFVAKLNPAGTTLTYGAYLGTDNGYDRAYGLAVDGSGNGYLTGETSSTGFPVTAGAFDPVLGGFSDAFVTKLAMEDYIPPLPVHNCAPARLGDISVGQTPRGIAVDSARQRVYVANFGSDSLSVIDSNTNTVIDTITGITAATGITYDPDHSLLWVSNYSTNEVTPIEINGDGSFTVLSALEVGRGPWGVAYSAPYGQVYVANSLDNSVSVIEAASQTVVATLADDFNQPFHLAANPANGKVYVTNFGNNSVSLIEDSTVTKVIPLYDSSQPYGIAVDEMRELVYVATVAPNRIVAIGPIRGVPDQFLGWAAFYRGFGDRNRPVPMRVIAVNPEIGPAGDGGHLWSTTTTADGSELDQLLLIPKGWTGYFHYPLAQNVDDNPSEGITIDRATDRVYVSSGTSPGTVSVFGDHPSLCTNVGPAGGPDGANEIDFELFTAAGLARGDVTGDGRVDIRDLAFIASRYRSTDTAADINGDGQVDILDLSIVANHYGQVITDTEQ